MTSNFDHRAATDALRSIMILWVCFSCLTNLLLKTVFLFHASSVSEPAVKIQFTDLHCGLQGINEGFQSALLGGGGGGVVANNGLHGELFSTPPFAQCLWRGIKPPEVPFLKDFSAHHQFYHLQ